MENVDSKPKLKKRRRKLPPNVVEKKVGGVKKWFVRKNITLNKYVFDEKTGKQKFIRQQQFWKLCEPQTKERASELLKQIEAELELRRSGAVKPKSLFSEIAEEFERVELVPAIYEKGKKIAGRRSLEAPRLIVEMLKQKFGHRIIKEITHGDLEDFKLERLKTPIVTKNTSRPRSIRQVNYELSFLRQIFNFARRRRWLDRSPFDDERNIIDVASENRRHVTWTREEEARALAYCETSNLYAHMKAVIICLVDGGFRIGELLQMKWSEVDFGAKTMPAKSYKGKNLTIRPVYMTKRMRGALSDWKKKQKEINKISDKTLVVGYASVKNAWETISEKIGRSDMNIHDLRHIYASRLAFDAKIPLPLVSRALGHSNTTTTERYINAKASDIQSLAEAVDRLNEE